MQNRMSIRTASSRALSAFALIALALGLSGCGDFFDYYPNAEEPEDMAGTWTHGSATLVLKEDLTFVMTDMPDWVLEGDSSRSTSAETVSCSGTFDLFEATQNASLSSSASGCSAGFFATGRDGEMTIAFGIDSGSGDPRCFELVRRDSELTPQGIDECWQYN